MGVIATCVNDFWVPWAFMRSADDYMKYILQVARPSNNDKHAMTFGGIFEIEQVCVV